MAKNEEKLNEVAQAHSRWREASEKVSQLNSELFQLGDGYGDPGARAADEHRLDSARHDAERLFREFHEVDRREMEEKMLDLQKSQHLATWASFAVAAVVGLATVVSTLTALFN